MYTASEKRKNNIAEYLLYMWQIEDIIRANDLDIDKIDHNIIDKYTTLSPIQRNELHQWYESLIDMMRQEGKEKSGHLQINNNILSTLVGLHQALLKDPKFPQYTAQFYKALPYIVELRAKSGESKSGEIETCFNALYGMLLMRLQQKNISPETINAVKEISSFIAILSHYYHLDEKDSIFNKD